MYKRKAQLRHTLTQVYHNLYNSTEKSALFWCNSNEL